MKITIIWHHLGLGDHFHCNALVRNISKEFDRVFLFVKSRNLKNVQFLYRDLSKINFIQVEENVGEAEMQWILGFNLNLLRVGFQYLNHTSLNFDEAFYEQAGLPFSKKFDDFYMQRDLAAEKTLYNKINPNDEPFVFLHEDKERGFIMNREHIVRKDLKIIENNNEWPLVHLVTLFEKSEEIHCMESSVKNLIDYTIPQKENAYFHKYMRKNLSGKTHIAIGRNYWNVIE